MRAWLDRHLRGGRRSEPEHVRVFMLDDHELVRLGVTDILQLDPSIEVVGEAATLGEARTTLRPARPDVALLDARLPDGSGIEFCRELHGLDPGIACVIFTSFDDEAARMASVIAGAAGFLVKDAPGQRLTSVIRDAASGRKLHGNHSAAALKALRAGPPADAPLGPLTAREAAVRDLLLENKSDREIAEELDVDERAVRAAISGIITKITTHDARHRVKNARPPRP